MRSLYWKIFLSFWLATVLIIVTTAWITSAITRKATIPTAERILMDSYATAAVATYSAGKPSALLEWLQQSGKQHHLQLYLLQNDGKILSKQPAPASVLHIRNLFMRDLLDDGLIKYQNLLVSHEIVTANGEAFRLAALSLHPLPHSIPIPWAGLLWRLFLAIGVSGLICYWLSLYLTGPLRSLRQAARSLATGRLKTRVGTFRGHSHDEIADLGADFDRMAEQLEEMIEAKERLLGDISHDLRTPLARLQIAIALAHKKSPGKAEQEFSRMELECKRLDQLIGEILQFARLHHSEDAPQKENAALVPLLESLIADCQYESSEKALQFAFQPQIFPQMDIDSRMIRRALDNILHNAMQYSPPQGCIHILLEENQSEDCLQIQITDQGPGVPPEELDKIFAPFHRVDSTRSSQTGGFGLGLAIAQKLIALHQGTIDANNLPSGGLCITIRFPLSTI